MTQQSNIRPPKPAPLAHSIQDAISASSAGRTTIFAAIRAGALKARKIGRRTVILDDDLRAWLAALPAANSGGAQQ